MIFPFNIIKLWLEAFLISAVDHMIFNVPEIT